MVTHSRRDYGRELGNRQRKIYKELTILQYSTKLISFFIFSQWCLINDPSIYYHLGALKIAWVTSSPNDIIEGKSKDLECFFFGTTSPRQSLLVQGWRTNHKRSRRYLSLRGRDREEWRENSPQHTSSSTRT